jgi:hypothetical protein
MVDIYVGPENTHWILHEKLLCARSTFFRSIFYDDSKSASSSKSFGLPDDDDDAFKSFVGWLYSGTVPPPRAESDLGVCFELYLMGERWGIEALRNDVLDVVRTWYWDTNTYPGLRRVQYVYANTEEGSAMRKLLVGSVARMLVLSNEGLPKHWDKALRKNGQLAVDIITRVQQWNLHEEEVPDPRAPEENEAKKVSETAKGSEKEVEVKKGLEDNKKLLDNELPNGLTNGIVNGEVNGINGHH